MKAQIDLMILPMNDHQFITKKLLLKSIQCPYCHFDIIMLVEYEIRFCVNEDDDETINFLPFHWR